MNNPLRSFSLMLEALNDLQPEIEAAQAGQTNPLPADPLSKLGPLPKDALLLGLASDGLPLLLNLHDPLPGPLLIAADPAAGKTALLQAIAQTAAQLHTPSDVQFGVVTNYPDEWLHLAESEHCVGVFPTYHEARQRTMTRWQRLDVCTTAALCNASDQRCDPPARPLAHRARSS